MSLSAIEPVSGDTSLSTLPDPPTGVPQERVDPYTLETIQLLFRAKGLLFLAALLHLALAKQYALPGLGSTDCAVITARSIRELSTQIHWGYDTTEKYLVILCALGFLYKGKSPNGGIEYSFPLCRYVPPTTLTPLEEIIRDYRTKVQSLARKVKARFLTLVVDQNPQNGRLLPSPASISLPFDLSGALQDIHQIMQTELGAGALPQKLLVQITGALRYRCQYTPDQTEDSGNFSSQESPISEPKGDFLPQQESPVLSTKGNSFIAVATGSRPFPSQTGDFTSTDLEVPSSKKLPVLLRKGDSLTNKEPLNGQLSVQTGDFAPETAPNVNVITLIGSITLNVSAVALFCCKALGENPGKRGIYCKLFREVDFDAQIITAALVYTLVHREDGTIRKPQAVFYQRCKDYHQSGVPEEAATLVERYGQLTYPQLLDTLHRKVPLTQSSSAATRSTSHRQQPQLRIPRAKETPGMSRGDLKLVVELLTSDERTCGLFWQPYLQADGSCALLIDDRLQHQRWVYSLKEWRSALAQMRVTQDLFSPRGGR